MWEVVSERKGECDNHSPNKKVVHVLIDLGATYNFMYPTLLKNLKAPMSNLLPLNVMLANGAKIKIQGEVNASLQLQ